MRPQPYIGVTGFMQKVEVEAALRALHISSTHKLMVGVLASWKTLQGKKNKYPNRYPLIGNLTSVFTDDPRALNLIHYTTDDQQTLADQVSSLRHWGGPLLHGFQFNIAWPDPTSFSFFGPMGPSRRIVLQLGGRALGLADNDPVRVAKMLDRYTDATLGDVISDVLIDPSGGRGVPFDPETALRYVRAIAERHPQFGIGIAGGLSAKTMHLVEPVLQEYPFISMDAEGRLRTPEDDYLDPELMREYITSAAALVK